MKKNQDQTADALRAGSATVLCRRAEERLRRLRPEGGGQRTEVETARLVHELKVHQIELEMQNEELKTSRAEVESGLALYADLYDFAPTGYLTLDREGAMRQVNLTVARQLGVERSRLVKRRFGQFVAESDRRAFSDFLEKVFASEAKECCEVTLPHEGPQPLVVWIQGTRSADGQECRAVVLDITERKRAEEALLQQTEELRARNEELTRFNRVAVGRELRMVELKQEISELCRRLGEPSRHAMSLPPGSSVPSAGPDAAPLPNTVVAGIRPPNPKPNAQP